jgi:hypothetical protein
MQQDDVFSYPVARKALAKWATEKLERVDSGDGAVHFRFRYNGSTCNNGGVPYTAFLNARIRADGADGRWTIDRAWIEVPEDERPKAALMCAAPGDDAGRVRFFADLEAPQEFSGYPLEEVIARETPENFAGCLCGKAHVNQKWKMALSAMHYALANQT